MDINAYQLHRDTADYHDTKARGFITKALNAATPARADAYLKFHDMHRSMAGAARDKARSCL